MSQFPESSYSLQDEGPQLSVVLACYNEAHVFEKSVARIRRHLDDSCFSWELIFVDDSSTDGTREMISALTEDSAELSALFHTANEGRGKTVADGLRMARGPISSFLDIDLEIDSVYLPVLANEIRKGADVATVLRTYKLSLRSIHRQVLSKGYIQLVRRLLKVPLLDTETGCKCFNTAKILPILEETQDTHWFWDTEVMVRSWFKGYHIREVPAPYVRNHGTGTTVRLWRDSFRYAVNLLALRRELQALPRPPARKGKA